MVDRKILSKQNREKGARFERKFRAYMESKGWVVDKFTNNIDLDKEKIVPAKSNKFMLRTTGFPDFLVMRKKTGGYEVRFIECKVNGYLKPIEREKMEFLIKRGHRCFVAHKKYGRIEIEEYKKKV